MKIIPWTFAFIIGVLATVVVIVITIKVAQPKKELIIHDVFMGKIHYFIFQDKIVNYTSDSIEYANTVPTHEDSIELGGNIIWHHGDTVTTNHDKLTPGVFH